jgi:tetratricopeptide (TPR) repeat protein
VAAIGCASLACSSPAPIADVPLDHAEADVADAVQRALAAAREDPKDPERLRALGDLYRIGGWSKAAASVYARGETLQPEQFLWPYLQGVSLAALDMNGAQAAFERAIALDANYAPVRLRLAEILERLGQSAAAAEQYEEVGRLAPDRIRALLHRARVALAANDTQTAGAALQQARKVAPQSAAALRLSVRWAEMEARAEESAAFARRARDEGIADEWNDPRADLVIPPVGTVGWIREGKRRHRAGDYAGAMDAFREALKRNPALGEVYFALGTSAALAGDFDRAERAYQAAHERRPNDVEIMFRLGRLRRRAGKPESALVALADAAERDSAYPGLAREQGRALAELGRLREGYERLRAARTQDPTDGWAWMHAGVTASRLGLDAEAESEFQQAVQRIPDSADVWYNLAVARMAAGRESAAREALAEARRLRPNDAQIRRAWAAMEGGS